MELPERKYTIKSEKTSSVPVTFETVEILADNLKNGWLMLWQHHKVFLAKIEDSQLTWLANTQPAGQGNDKNHLVQLRAFNKNSEYYFWRNGNEIKGRFRRDGEGRPAKVMDTSMVLRGVIAAQTDLTQTKNHKNISIITRNYIGCNDLEQAGYIDSRFIDFTLI